MQKSFVFSALLFSAVVGFSFQFHIAGASVSDVTLPPIFSDHMVLCRSEKVPVWGKADPGVAVSVILDGQTKEAVADVDGNWIVNLNLENSPPGPFEMIVRGGGKTIHIADVVVGEVWLAGGQSNMELSMFSIINASAEIAASSNAMVRQYIARKLPSPHDLIESGEGYWTVAKPGTTETFSALQYFFGKEIQTSLGVPVGIINACWGGKRIEPFISTNSVAASSLLRPTAETTLQRITSQNAAFKSWLTETGRDDSPASEISAFTTGSVSTGWTAVSDSGTINSPDLPKYGAIWFRKDVTIPAQQLGSVQVLQLGPIAMFERVYVNGTFVGETTLQTYIGPSKVRYYLIPPSVLHEGTNQLAVRIFAPALSPGFSWAPKIGKTALGGGWQAKAEFSLSEPETPAPTITGQFAAYSSLFNGMIHPLIPYAIRGVIWYQGESNVNNADDYRTSFPLLIQDWRQQWGQGSFPFYFCQLANYLAKTNTPGESTWADLREAQRMALAEPDTGMAVLIDTGESEDVHPQSKSVAGSRMARIALANTYGQSIPFSGPVYTSMSVENGKIRLTFTHMDGGLVAQDLPSTYIVRTTLGTSAPLVRNSPQSQLEGFAVCGEDGQWVWADASIDGDTVLVWSDQVPAPVQVRYAWADNPTCNLYNGAGLPASPFETPAPAPVTPPPADFIQFDGATANASAVGIAMSQYTAGTLTPDQSQTYTKAYSSTTPLIDSSHTHYSGQAIYGGSYIRLTNGTASDYPVTAVSILLYSGNLTPEAIKFQPYVSNIQIGREGNAAFLFTSNGADFGFDASSSLSAKMNLSGSGGGITNRWLVVAGGVSYVSEATIALSSTMATLTLDNPDEINWAVWTPGADMAFGSLTFNVAGRSITNITHAGVAVNATLPGGTSNRIYSMEAFSADFTPVMMRLISSAVSAHSAPLAAEILK